MEILLIILSNFMFALMFTLYCRNIQGCYTFHDGSMQKKTLGQKLCILVRRLYIPLVLFTLIMTVALLFIEVQGANPVIADLLTAALFIAAIIAISTLVWRKNARAFRPGVVFMAYVTAAVVHYISFIATKWVLSFWMPENFAIVHIIAYVVSIPMHYFVFWRIRRIMGMVDGGIRDIKILNGSLPFLAGLMFVFVALRGLMTHWALIATMVFVVPVLGYLLIAQLKGYYIRISLDEGMGPLKNKDKQKTRIK